jgi:6-methylsalicylate decarboxylase
MAGHRIDVHVHAIPEAFKQASRAAGRGATITSGFPAWSPEEHLALMDRHGIATGIMSISQPGAHFGDDVAAAKLARLLNDEMAALVAANPARFGAFAVLPVPNIPAAIDEIRYALDTLKLDGIGMLASYEGVFLGDPIFDPVLAVLDEYAAPVLIHPALAPTSKQLTTDYPGFMAEFTIDTTRAVVHMIFSGVLERFPNIKFILSHAGGTIPFLSWRLSMAPLIDRTRFGHRTPEWVMEQVKCFWYDTAISAGAQNFAALDVVAEPSRVLFGTDWPYCPDAVAERCIAGTAALPEKRRMDVERNNALALFPRLRG